MDLFGGAASPGAAKGRVRPASAAEALDPIAGALPPGLRLGTSSWTFPGWTGIVYEGVHSQKVLARQGLRAYGAHPLLRAVGLDRTFYRPMTAGELEALADQVPESFRFLVKAPRELTTPVLDRAPRVVEGRVNRLFLDSRWASENIAEPVKEGLGERAGVVLFQFPPLYARAAGGPDRFASSLERFLAALPAGLTYAVELRTPELFTTAYADALTRTGAAHAFNVHPRMLSFERQLEMISAASGPALVVRWMLGGRMRYDEARGRFDPFDRLVLEDPTTRAVMGSACLHALAAGREAIVIANNKAEGSAPLSLFQLAGWIAEELAESADASS
jgi:uncharacterized protein YecE (DUF72 family)